MLGILGIEHNHNRYSIDFCKGVSLIYMRITVSPEKDRLWRKNNVHREIGNIKN